MKTGPVLRIARIVLEASAPLAIASGEPHLDHDVMLARDPNGLPTIPGTSLAGVLRSHLGGIIGAAAVKTLFGDDLNASDAPGPGRLAVGDALCLGVNGTPLDGLAVIPDNDPVFECLARVQPVRRDHVRLNARGVVDGAGKFTRAAVPRGTRFLSQFEIWEDGEVDATWEAFLEALRGPASRLRIGSATRSGYGAARIVSLELRDFDMRVPDDRNAARGAVSLATSLGGRTERIQADDVGPASWTLQLVPEGPFRFGQGAAISDDPADLRPVRETVIDWGEGNAPPMIHEDRLFVPASAVKGALRHRTAFHHRRLECVFANAEYDAEAALAPLFGRARDSRGDGDGGEPQGAAGCVYIDDISLPTTEPRRIARTGIDRFSGGVRRKALFTEDVIDSSAALTLRVSLKGDIRDKQLVKAFEHALADLAHGWLPLGAGGTKGLGVFRDPDPEACLVARFEERIGT